MARQLGWLSPILALPVLVSAVITAWAVRTIRKPSVSYAMDHHDRKITLQATIGEGIGIVILSNILANAGLMDYIIPSIASIVGLHFIYVAYYIPRPIFHHIGIFLLVGALVGLALGPQKGNVLIGIGTATLFWAIAARALVGVGRTRRRQSS